MKKTEVEKFLKEQGLPTRENYKDTLRLLKAKRKEYIDTTGLDAETKELFDEVQDYLEEMEKSEEGGLTLKLEEEEPEKTKEAENEAQKEIKKEKIGRRAPSQTVDIKNVAFEGDEEAEEIQDSAYEQEGAPLNQTGQPVQGAQNPVNQWFRSLNGNAAIDDLFQKAVDNLKYDEWDMALQRFESIKEVENRNASAFLGIALAKRKLRTAGELINLTDKNLSNDTDLRRARDYGSPSQHADMDRIFEQQKKNVVYMEAMKALREKKNVNDVREAKQKFTELGNYQDAAQQIAKCDEAIEEISTREKRAADEQKILRKLSDLEKKIVSELEECENAVNKATLGGKATDKYHNAKYRMAKKDIEDLEKLYEENKNLVTSYSVKRIQTLKERFNAIPKKHFDETGRFIGSVFDWIFTIIVCAVILCGGIGYGMKNEYFAMAFPKYFPIVPYGLDTIEVEKPVFPFLISVGGLKEVDVDLEGKKNYNVFARYIRDFEIRNFEGKKVPLAASTPSLTLSNCNTIEEVVLPKSGTTNTLEIYACDNVKKVVAENGELRTLKLNALSINEPIEYPDSVLDLTYVKCENLTKLVIPAGMSEVNISDCSNLKEIVFEGNVDKLTISSCPKLVKVVAEGSVYETDISYCEKLKYFKVKQGGDTAYVADCNALKQITIAKSFRELNLSNCEKLVEVNVPEQATVNAENCPKYKN